MNKKTSRLLVHIPVWIVAIFVAWIFSTDSFPGMQSSYSVLATLVCSVWMLGSFYLFYSWLVPKYLAGGNKGLFWIYGLLLVLVIIPFIAISLLLVTKTSAVSLAEILSAQGLLPYLGTVIITLVCSVLGALYRLLLMRYLPA